MRRFPRNGRVDVDDARMILRHEASQRLLLFAAIALLVLLTTASSAKSRKPRRWSATKVPPNTGPVIVTVISKYPDDKRVYHAASTGCTEHCGNTEGLDVSGTRFEQDRPDERYVVYPKKYEDFVSRKNARHASRYRRHVALSAIVTNASDDLAAVERGASEPSGMNGSKGKLKKVTLYNDWHKRVKSKEARGNVGRARRSIAIDGDRQSRRNTSDYYAQRRAVMERYYARQREINARYAANRTNRTDDAPRGAQPSATRNATLFRFGHEYLNGLLNATAGSGAAFRHSSVTIDPLYSQENGNGRSIATRLNVVPEVGRGLRFDRGNVSLDHYTTPATCANAPLAGTFAPKARSKQARNCTDGGETDGTTVPTNDVSSIRQHSWNSRMIGQFEQFEPRCELRGDFVTIILSQS